MADHVMIVFTECRPGEDEEFNAWYTGTHVPDVLRLDGFTAVQRFREAATEQEEGPTYLAVWEVEGDVEAAKRALANGPPRFLSPSHDPSRTSIRFYSAITERIAKAGLAEDARTAADPVEWSIDSSVPSR
jgi:hypothetical protein